MTPHAITILVAGILLVICGLGAIVLSFISPF